MSTDVGLKLTKRHVELLYMAVQLTASVNFKFVY